MMLRKKKDGGFTAIELMVVVAAIGVLVALVVATLGNSNRGLLAKRVTDDISLIAAQANSYRGADANYAFTNGLKDLDDLSLLPEGWDFDTTDTTAVTNPAGGLYKISVGTDKTQVVVEATGLDAKVCANVQHKLKDGAASVGTDCATGTAKVTFN